MKNRLLCTAGLLLCASHAMADAFYLAGRIGGSVGHADDLDPKQSQSYFNSGSNLLPDPHHESFTDTVISWGGAVGYDYRQWYVPFRMEIEYLYRNRYDYDTSFVGVSSTEAHFDGVANTSTILANFYMDIPVNRVFGFFFGAGLGQAVSTTSAHVSGCDSDSCLIPSGEGSADNASFSWMGTAGISVAPVKWFIMDLSYRYSDLGDLTYQVGRAGYGGYVDLETTDFTAQEFYFGARVLIPNMLHKKRPKHQYLDK